MIYKLTNPAQVDDFIAKNRLTQIHNWRKLCQPEFYTDSLTAPTSLFGREAGSNYFSLTSTDPAFLSNVWERFLQPAEKEGFCLWASSPDARKFYVSQGHAIEQGSVCSLLVYNGKPLPRFDTPYKAEPLRPEDYHIVVENHQFGANLEHITACATQLPTSAIYVGGELASWSLVHLDGTFGPIFTLEKFRNRHLARVVAVDLFEKALKIGLIPCACVIKGNTASEVMCRSVNLEYVRDVCWSWTREVEETEDAAEDKGETK